MNDAVLLYYALGRQVKFYFFCAAEFGRNLLTDDFTLSAEPVVLQKLLNAWLFSFCWLAMLRGLFTFLKYMALDRKVLHVDVEVDNLWS